MVSLGKYSRNLTALNLSNCHKITENGVGSLAKGCPNLEVIQVKGCFQLSTKGIRRLTESCANIRELNLQDCKEIDNSSMDLISKLKELQSLELKVLEYLHMF